MSSKSIEFSKIQLIDGDRGKNYPKESDLQKKGFCLFLSAKNITSSGFDPNDASFITREKNELLRAGKIQNGDIVITPKVPETLGFSLCLLNLDSTIRYSTDSSLGSTMPYAIWRNGLAEHKIVLPPPQIMVAFSKLIAPLIKKIQEEGLNVRNLSYSRDALLPRLMSGELKVN